MNNYRIDNLQYCNWSKEIFQINNEAKLNAIHVTIAYHENFNEVEKNLFGVNLISHTKSETTWNRAQIHDLVNLEIDTLARYVARLTDIEY